MFCNSNHRFFESVIFERKLVEEGKIGKVLSFNGRIGHNGERLKNSWFWKKEISGGGTLLDNGCHLLDLSRLFVGNFTSGKGLTSNSFWKILKLKIQLVEFLKLTMVELLQFIVHGGFFRLFFRKLMAQRGI